MLNTSDYIANLMRTSLENLMEKHSLSVRAYNVCSDNGLTNLGLLLDFWHQKGSFLSFRNMGKKTEKELSEVCIFYVSKFAEVLGTNNFTITEDILVPSSFFNSFSEHQLFVINGFIEKQLSQLSSSAVNALNRHFKNVVDFENIQDAFFNNKASIKKIGHIREKTIQEILSFVNLIEEYAIAMPQIGDETIEFYGASYNPTFNTLTERQQSIINLFIQNRFKNLSNRAANALNIHLNHSIDFISIRPLLNNKSIIRRLQNIGKLTTEELLNYISLIEEYAISVSKLDDTTAEVSYFADNLIAFFKLPETYLDLYLMKILNNQFPLFAFLQQVIFDNKVLDDKRTSILKHRMGYFANIEALTLDELGEQFGLTRERIRQLTYGLESDFAQKLQFLNEFKSEFLKFTDYRIDFTNDCILIRKSQADNINQLENCQFTPKFISKILSYLHTDTHIAFGEKLKYFENIYIINRSLIKQFDFTALFDNITLQVDEVIEEDFTCDCDGYLFPFLKTQNATLLPRIRQVCMNIVSTEFTEGVEIDFDDNLIFRRNKKTAQYEYILEILEEYDEPMTVQEISDALIERDNKNFFNLESIRSAMGKEKNIFIYFGKTSTYGLLKWEKERTNIKGGTIRDITEEYLNKFNEPKHFIEIAEFVLKYRPNTNPWSVNSNLQAGGDRFRELGGGFWGLPKKTYVDTEFKKTPKFLLRYIQEWIELFPENTEGDMIQHFSEKYDLRKIQLVYFIERNIKDGILRRENNKIGYVENSVYN